MRAFETPTLYPTLRVLSDEPIEALIPCLEVGPPSAIVTNVDISEISDEIEQYKLFEIR